MNKKSFNKSEKSEPSANLEDLKKEYESYKEKYNLPNFTELNKVFDIEEVGIETEFFLRKIRRVISDRISAYLRFIEITINPSNAPLFFFKLVKRLNVSDRESLSQIYDKLSHFEIDIIALDLDYSEDNEAEFINKAYNIFRDNVKNNLLIILEKLNNDKANKTDENNSSYFG